MSMVPSPDSWADILRQQRRRLWEQQILHRKMQVRRDALKSNQSGGQTDRDKLGDCHCDQTAHNEWFGE